jgi:hypothetical protein
MFCVDDTEPVNDMHVDFEPGAGHPDRGADAVLLVHHEVLRQHVQNLPTRRQGHGFGRIDRPAHVVARDSRGSFQPRQ